MSPEPILPDRLGAIETALRECFEEDTFVLFDADGKRVLQNDPASDEIVMTIRQILSQLLSRMPADGFEDRNAAKAAIHASLTEVLAEAPRLKYEFDAISGKLVIKRPTPRVELQAEVKIYHAVAKVAGLLGFSYWAMAKSGSASAPVNPMAPDQSRPAQKARTVTEASSAEVRRVKKFYGLGLTSHFSFFSQLNDDGDVEMTFVYSPEGELYGGKTTALEYLERACARAGARDVSRLRSVKDSRLPPEHVHHVFGIRATFPRTL